MLFSQMRGRFGNIRAEISQGPHKICKIGRKQTVDLGITTQRGGSMKKLIWTTFEVQNSNSGFIVQKWEGLVQNFRA